MFLCCLQEREDLIEAYEEEREREIRQAVAEKEEDLQTLSEQLKNLRTGYDELLTSHEQAHKTNEELEASVKELKVSHLIWTLARTLYHMGLILHGYYVSDINRMKNKDSDPGKTNLVIFEYE